MEVGSNQTSQEVAAPAHRTSAGFMVRGCMRCVGAARCSCAQPYAPGGVHKIVCNCGRGGVCLRKGVWGWGVALEHGEDMERGACRRGRMAHACRATSALAGRALRCSPCGVPTTCPMIFARPLSARPGRTGWVGGCAAVSDAEGRVAHVHAAHTSGPAAARHRGTQLRPARMVSARLGCSSAGLQHRTEDGGVASGICGVAIRAAGGRCAHAGGLGEWGRRCAPPVLCE
jgi:hypothetical protein